VRGEEHGVALGAARDEATGHAVPRRQRRLVGQREQVAGVVGVGGGFTPAIAAAEGKHSPGLAVEPAACGAFKLHNALD
jgi:hypothetical protein